jgi:integrase/recombinase XerD
MIELEHAIEEFEAFLAARECLSHNSLLSYHNDCEQFRLFLSKKNISQLEAINQAHLRAFLYHLKRDLEMKATSMSRKVSCLKRFFSFVHQQYQTQNWGEVLIFPRLEKRLPKYITERVLKKLFERAEKNKSFIGRRNFMMLHLMYVTGMRVSELVLLKNNQLRLDMGLITILGKGSKERLVPLPAYTIQLLEEYLQATRGALLTRNKKIYSSDILFPVLYGKRIKHVTRQAFWKYVKRLDRSIQKLSPHIFRHSLATHLLHKGVDLRSLQMILGHEHLTTVEIYTHVDMSHLRAAYNKKHLRS